MKSKITIFLLLTLTLTLLLIGCKPSDGGNGQNDPADNSGNSANDLPTDGNIIYSENTELNIVIGGGFDSSLAYDIQEEVYNESDVLARIYPELPNYELENAIYLGRVDNEMSRKAYAKLEDLIEVAELDSGYSTIYVGYVYYVSGNSVAIAYSDDMYDSTAEVATDDLIDNFIRGKNYLSLKSGFAVANCYSYIDFLEDADEKYYEKAWATLLEKTDNPELVEALQKLKALYNNRAVSWLADLYDEEIGAFYYSNSGRNNVGFLPDADSTYQAIVLVGHMGMQENFGYGRGSYPENFWYKIGNFVKKLQDPNGYFYHPQWTKEMVDAKLSRRGRDLDRSEQLLKMAGMKPTYDTPNGTKGDGLAWDENSGGFIPLENLVQPLSSVSAVSAVSMVVPTSTAAVADHFKTKAALEAYLQKFLDDGKNFYSINNELASQTNQILARDKKLAASGENWRCAEIIIAFLNKHQNPENGSWSNNTDYNAVDGLFKAAHVYTALGYQIPNAMAAARLSLNAITSEQATTHICNIYNCWQTLLMVMRNMKQFGAPDEAKVVLEAVRMVAAPSIEATLVKYLEFQKEDKSFSYYKDRCSAESQGMQLAIECNEGDMNATSLTYSVWPTIFSVLGLEEYEVWLHGSADFASFIETIDGIGGVIKNPAPKPEAITFDNELVGSASNDVTYSLTSPGSYAEVKDDPRYGVSGNILELASYPGGGDVVYVGVDKLTLGTCFIFEGEFCIADAKNGYVMQINLGASCYMLNLNLVDAVDEKGERYKKVQILESSSQGSPRIERDLGVSAALGEWFKLRFEYYVGTHDSVRIKVYFNDTLAAVSDNYYDHKGTKITTGTGSPNKYYTYTQMNVISGQMATIFMDNLFAAKTEDRYVPEHDLENQPLINDDPPVREEIIYDFEDLETGKIYPADFNVTENSGSVEIVGADGAKKLNIKALGEKTTPSILIPAVVRGPKTNCAVVEMDVVANSGSVGSALNVRLRANDKVSGDTGSITAFNLEIVEKDGETYVVVTDAPNGATVSVIDNSYVKLDEGFKLRLEHYESENVTLIYINNTLIAASSMLTTGGGNRVFMTAELSAITQSVIDISVDNLKAERIVKSFVEATKPEVDEKIYDFETDHTDLTTNGQIISAVEGNGLKLNDGKNLTLPLNIRAVITNFVSFKANTTFAGINDSVYRVAFTTETGAYVLAYEFVSVGGDVFIYEFTESGRANMPIASFTPSQNAELEINYYPSNKVCQIFYADSCVAVTSVIYSSEAADYAITKTTVNASGNGSLTLDNCVLESYNSLYVAKTPIGNNSENGSDKLTFESSSTGNLPSAVTKKLYSLGASVRIEELIDRLGNAGKALVFDSTSDTGGDEVAFKITERAEGEWNALVFEADIAFRAENLNKLSYQIFFEDITDSENTRQYLTSITYGDGKLKLKDYSSSSSSVTTKIDGQEYKTYRNDGPLLTLAEPRDATEWFTLRIEIFKGIRNEMRILTYINDSLVYVTNNFYRSHISDDPNDISRVTQVRFLALTSCEATILMDNVSLKQTTKEIPTDTTGATVKLYPTTNKPVIVIPEVPDDTDIPEIIDYENGRIYTNTKGEDKNGTEQPKLEIKDGKLYFTSDGGDYLYITPTVKKGSYNHASFEADLTFGFNTTNTTGSAAFYTFSVNDENNKTSFRFNIEYNMGTGEIKFVVFNVGKTYASTAMKKVIGAPGVPTQESISFNYRIEYYFIGSEAVILNYFDNELVYAVNSRESQSYVTNDGVNVDYNLYYNYSGTTPTSPYGTVGGIDINVHSNRNATMSLDNLRFVQDNKTLDETLVAPKPGTLIKGTTGTGVYYKANGGYEYNISNIWSEADLNNANAKNPFLWRTGKYIHGEGKTAAAGKYGYIQPASQGANKVLEYGQENGDIQATVLDIKSVNSSGNLYVFETDIVIGSMNNILPGEAAVSFGLRYGKGEYESFFGNLMLVMTSDGTYRLGYSVDKTYPTVIEASTWYNIAIEYYHEEGIARYYVNGVRVGSEKIVTNGTIPEYAFASISISASATDAFVRIDNTVVSAYDKAFVPIDGEVDSLATVLPVKGGANGIVVLIHDDGDLDTVARLDRIYGKYSLRADVAMVVNRVYDTTTDAPKQANVDLWKTYIDTERWGLINHSLSHTFWGSATEDELTIDEQKLYEEVVASGEYLREAFSSERVLTYAYPGFSSVVSGLGYGKLRTYAAAKALIAANYISAREYNFISTNQPTVDLSTPNYNFLSASSISLGTSNLEKNLVQIDNAALGGLTVLFSHKVCADGEEKASDSSTVPESYIEAIAKRVSGYVNEGMLWNAHYEDAILYLREASSATVRTVSDSDSITLTLTDTLDDAIYNYALTVEVIVPTSWAGVKVVQNGNTSYARAFERDGKWIVYVDIVPDAGDAVLTPESENLPHIPVLPCDHVDSNGDAECDRCERFYSDPDTCVHKDIDGNRICDKCENNFNCEHIDANGNDKCDKCEATYRCPHCDTDNNHLCDVCGDVYYDPSTCEHKDDDENGKCDNCGNTLSGSSIGEGDADYEGWH